MWKKLLSVGGAFCYIKPNRRKHESGFRCFEVGYLVMDYKTLKVKDKLVLNETADHIQLYEYDNNRVKPNLDLTLDGYIRMFSYLGDEYYWWKSMDYVLSSAQLELLPKLKSK